MATFYTVFGNKQNDDWNHVNQKRAPGTDLGSGVLSLTTSWTTDGTQAAADIVRIAQLPPLAKVLPHLCYVHTSGTMAATTCTFDIGDSSDTDRYADGIDVQAAGFDLFTAPAVPAAISTPYQLATTDRWIYVTIATLTGAATNGTVATFNLVYSIAN